MIEKINAIRKAIECECYLPALALALTLPDICGQIEHPEYVKKNGERLVGKQYRTWFDDWVNHWYASPDGWIDNGAKAKNPYFTGKMCFDLRCSFLHSGNSDIGDFGEKENDENTFIYKFELCINGTDSIGEIWEDQWPPDDTKKIQKEKTVRIDLTKLCENLCESAERYYLHKADELFKEHNIKVIDIKKENDKINQLNQNNI